MDTQTSINSSMNLNKNLERNSEKRKCKFCSSKDFTKSRLRNNDALIISITGYTPYRCLDCYCRKWHKENNLQTIIMCGLILLLASAVIYSLFINEPIETVKAISNEKVIVNSHLEPVIISQETVKAVVSENLSNENISDGLINESVKTAPIKIEIVKESLNNKIIITSEDRPRELDVIEASVRGWRQSWEKGALFEYLDFYSKDFIPSREETMAAWRDRRTKSLVSSVNRKITVSQFDFSLSKDMSSAEVIFTQNYETDNYSDKVRKRLILQREGSDYKIIKEITLKIL